MEIGMSSIMTNERLRTPLSRNMSFCCAVGMCAMMNGGSWLDPNYWSKFYAGMMWQMTPQDYSGLPLTPPEQLPRLNIDKCMRAFTIN